MLDGTQSQIPVDELLSIWYYDFYYTGAQTQKPGNLYLIANWKGDTCNAEKIICCDAGTCGYYPDNQLFSLSHRYAPFSSKHQSDFY